MKEFKILFKNQNFLKLWLSQIFSQVTVNIMNFLLLTRLFTVTGSSIATSLLWVAYSLPAIFFGPIGAAAVDMVNRRKMLMITNLLQAVVVFSYILFHNQSIFILYGIVLGYSLLNQFYNPAEAAYLPSAVAKKDLSYANSIFFITQQLSLVIGFGFAGLLQSLFGFNGSLILCSVFLFLAFISTTLLPNVKPITETNGSIEETFKTFFESILEGYKFIKDNKGILFPLLLLLGIQAGLAIITVSLPVIAKEILNISVNLAGISIVVPAGIGATLGSIYVSKILKNKMRKKVIIEYSLFAVAFSLLFIGLGIPFLPVVLRVTITSLLIVLVGFGFVGINIPTVTYLQEKTPLWLRGRVFGNLGFLITIVTVFPVLFSGFISEIFGVRTLLSLIGFIVLLVFIYAKRRGNDLVEENFAKEVINNG